MTALDTSMEKEILTNLINKEEFKNSKNKELCIELCNLLKDSVDKALNMYNKPNEVENLREHICKTYDETNKYCKNSKLYEESDEVKNICSFIQFLIYGRLVLMNKHCSVKFPSLYRSTINNYKCSIEDIEKYRECMFSSSFAKFYDEDYIKYVFDIDKALYDEKKYENQKKSILDKLFNNGYVMGIIAGTAIVICVEKIIRYY